MMNVLIVGNGGREHAIAWKVAQSPLVETVFVAPGNPGTAQEHKVRNVPIDALDIPALVLFAQEHHVGLTIIGAEAPLAEGIVDEFSAHDLPCFGPTSRAAMLESSKNFSKTFMTAHGIPTAKYAAFRDETAAKAYLKDHPLPVVIKADGLAAGKGVVIAATIKEAHQAIEDMLGGAIFGDAGQCVVIEEFLTGKELSFIVMSDGQVAIPLSTSQDHKARDAGNKGPNTGGMGAYSPVPFVTPALEKQIMTEIVEPTLKGMREQDRFYVGFLYVGVMLTEAGPKVLEFNCRLGDPETQPLLMRLTSDLVLPCLAAIDGNLATCELTWDDRTALGVVLASRGYPMKPETGFAIKGLPAKPAMGLQDKKIFHASTQASDEHMINTGGRVLCATALGETLAAAQAKAYELANTISWEGMFFREDIGGSRTESPIEV